MLLPAFVEIGSGASRRDLKKNVIRYKYTGRRRLDGWLVKLVAAFCFVVEAPPSHAMEHSRVAAGDLHTVVLRSDGTVWSWGNNDYGQLGDGTDVDQPTAVQTKLTGGIGLTGVVSVEAGPYHSLAISQGKVWSWGLNSHGQLGTGDTTARSVAIEVVATGFGPVDAVAAGGGHSLALSGGNVWAWGENTNGQLGDGLVADRTVPFKIPTLTNIKWIAAGRSHSLAVDGEGSVWAWGSDADGEMGNGAVAGNVLLPTKITSLSSIRAVAAGNNFSLALDSEGKVRSWGSNWAGQLGDGTLANRTAPVLLTLEKVSRLSAGSLHSFAVKADGTTWTWGLNEMGQLGDGTASNSNIPVLANIPADVTSVVAGDFTSFALRSDGTLISWGSRGEEPTSVLGDASSVFRSKPMQTFNLSDLTEIDAGRGQLGYSNIIARKKNNTVWVWGESNSPQPREANIPTEISEITAAVSVASGGGHLLAVTPEGSVFTWGDNDFGKLGDGTTISRRTPLLLADPNLVGISAVAAGRDFSIALKKNGTLLAWGSNENGALGDGSEESPPGGWSGVYASTPGAVVDITNVKAVAAGYYHTLALKKNGTVWAWGWNIENQLGAGHPDNRVATPQLVIQSDLVPLGEVVAIAAGEFHSLALTSDGSVWSWGSNSKGQLGTGSGSTSYYAEKISGLSEVVSIGAGANYSLAIKSDGSVWAWGENRGGLGPQDSDQDQPVPVQLVGTEAGRFDKAIGSSGKSFLLKEDGTLFSWGWGEKGELANGFPLARGYARSVLGFHMQDGMTPTIEITFPTEGSTLTLANSVTIQAFASVPSGTITGVHFYADGVLMGSDLVPPYTFDLSPTTWGNLKIHAIAASSGAAFSKPVYLTIQTPYDSDNDGLPDWLEIKHGNSLSMQPNGDADGDGLSNLWEYLNGFDPFGLIGGLPLPGEGPAEDPDNDGLTNAEEAVLGTRPRSPHTDGDKVIDGEDADPLDPLVDWKRSPKTQYIWIQAANPPAGYKAIDVNDRGQILFQNSEFLDQYPRPSGWINSLQTIPVGKIWDPYKPLNNQWTDIFFKPSAMGIYVFSAQQNNVVKKIITLPMQDTVPGTWNVHHNILGLRLASLGSDGSVMVEMRYTYTEFDGHPEALLLASPEVYCVLVWKESNYGSCALLGDYHGYRADALSWTRNNAAGFYTRPAIPATGSVSEVPPAVFAEVFEHEQNQGMFDSPLSLRNYAITNQAGVFDFSCAVDASRPATNPISDFNSSPPGSQFTRRGRVILFKYISITEHKYTVAGPDGYAHIPVPLGSFWDSVTELPTAHPDAMPSSSPANRWAVGGNPVRVWKDNAFQNSTIAGVLQFDEKGIGIGTGDSGQFVWCNGSWSSFASASNLEGFPSGVVPKKITPAGVIWGGNGEDVNGVLLPVEILDKDKKVVGKLNVAKMVDDGVLIGGADASLDPDKDTDRFYVRIPGIASAGAVSIRVGSALNPDIDYDDEGGDMTLVQEGSVLISKSMLLVSDNWDDGYKVDGIDDNSANDRTHKVQLGGSLVVKSFKIHGVGHAGDFKIPVPAKKLLRGKIFLMGDLNNFTNQMIMINLRKIASERYAQVGVQLSFPLSAADYPVWVNPVAVRWENGVGPTPKLLVNEDIKGLFDKAKNTSGAVQGITVLVVKNLFEEADNPRGKSIIRSLYEQSEAEYFDTVVISWDDIIDDGIYTLPHEIGHVLTGSGHYGIDYGPIGGNPNEIFHNLMRNITSSDLPSQPGSVSEAEKIGASKRINQQQADQFLPELLNSFSSP